MYSGQAWASGAAVVGQTSCCSETTLAAHIIDSTRQPPKRYKKLGLGQGCSSRTNELVTSHFYHSCLVFLYKGELGSGDYCSYKMEKA